MSLNDRFGQTAPQSKFNLHHDAILNSLDELEQNGNLYPAQVNALKGIRAHFANTHKENIALVVLPTGAGKSGVAVLAPFVLNSTKVLIITPSVIISNQLFNDMCGANSFYVKKGIIDADRAHVLTENGLLVSGSLGDSDVTVHRFRLHNLVIANAHKFGANSAFDMSKLPSDLFDTIIVDEAHHYPAATWKRIVDHFPRSRRVFLTATPHYKGRNILGTSRKDQDTRYLAYQLTREDAVGAGLLRPLAFFEANDTESFDDYAELMCEEFNMTTQYKSEISRILAVVNTLKRTIDGHDAQHAVHHQAMILCRLKDDCDLVVRTINKYYKVDVDHPPLAVAYHGDAGETGFRQFRQGGMYAPRFLVICGKATEGFDRREVSAVGILRNVAAASSVLFSQFVGRCVRKMGNTDPCVATVVSNEFHRQQHNFNNLDTLAEVDPEEED